MAENILLMEINLNERQRSIGVYMFINKQHIFHWNALNEALNYSKMQNYTIMFIQ